MNNRAFSVAVKQEVLDDLQTRLELTRWPDEVIGAGWNYGMDISYLKALVKYWQTSFDWREQEKYLNAFDHFQANIDGWGIHFIHARGKGTALLPLNLTHGWPGTFVELLKLVPLLINPENYGANPQDAFDIVVPSLPGYGFSERPSRLGPWPIHELWMHLMRNLGYEHFGAYGSDFGASITTELALSYPERLMGIHLTTASDIAWPIPIPDPSDLSEAEKDFLIRNERWDQEEGGYRHEQRTRPQTLAYGLNDSPAGLASWLVEKFRSWSDCDGHIERRFSKDELLTIVTLFWATQTINSSMRYYYERRYHPALTSQPHRFISVPTAVSMFPKDFLMPREWIERSYNLVWWREHTRGGHFPAMEEPYQLAEDIRAFFRPFRSPPA